MVLLSSSLSFIDQDDDGSSSNNNSHPYLVIITALVVIVTSIQKDHIFRILSAIYGRLYIAYLCKTSSKSPPDTAKISHIFIYPGLYTFAHNDYCEFDSQKKSGNSHETWLPCDCCR